ncbi:hypothetical protein [Geodermatophilus marinus]|uniref:hypothetical protein n=1 Tax=Geodermatophilus sp. LHW52908 TaxID=2303986 RepID=UPI001314B9E9|nr:hypothetical protein [Geodermatophilus sp. LHW52908]
MTAQNGPAPRTTGGTGPKQNSAATKPPRSGVDSRAVTGDPALFDAHVEVDAYSRRTTLVPSAYVTGPGPRPATTGREEAQAPAWWWAEAERIVLALIDSGHQVSSDDLHQRYPHEPSASGAAFGALFAKLARAGRIREVGMVRSRRPEARRRRIILWGAP